MSDNLLLSFKMQLKAKQLENAKTELEKDLEEIKDQLDRQREHRTEQEKRVQFFFFWCP